MHRETHVPLAPLTTLRVGGPARDLWSATSVRDVQDALAAAPDLFVLGGGSNVVFADRGHDGVVLHMASRGVAATPTIDGIRYEVAAGEPWDTFVQRTIADGCAGLECLSGIPGTVGGTPIQNVGAYGREVSEVIEEVRAVRRTTRIAETLTKDACRFEYRMSRFKRAPDHVVVSVTFTLPRRADALPIRYDELARALAVPIGGAAPLAAVRDTVIALRKRKGMVSDASDPDSVSVGSFFTNPVTSAAEADRIAASVATAMPRYPQPDGAVKLAAGWLVEQAGCKKGETLGGARISTKHALALVNAGAATAQDVVALARSVRDRVRARFGVTLEPEPVLVGLTI